MVRMGEELEQDFLAETPPLFLAHYVTLAMLFKLSGLQFSPM